MEPDDGNKSPLICPFCAGEAKIWETTHGVVSIVECESCKTKFVFPYDRKGNELFLFWNKRTNDGDV